MPDESKLFPGDLLLISAVKPSRGSRAIIDVQTKGGYDPEDARWHHAAAYLGGALICEAQVWPGVRLTSLYDYVGAHLLRFRRDANLSPDDRWRLALHTVYRLKQRYNFLALFRLWRQSRLGFWHPGMNYQNIRAMVCSQLYSDAFLLTTSELLVEGTLNIPIPAQLSLTPRLTDVEIGWLKLG